MIYDSMYNHNLVQDIYFRNNFSSIKVLITLYLKRLKLVNTMRNTCIWDGNTNANAVTPQTSTFSSQTIRGRKSSHTVCWGGNKHTHDEKVLNNVGNTTFQACFPPTLKLSWISDEECIEWLYKRTLWVTHSELSYALSLSLFANLKWGSYLNLGFIKTLEFSVTWEALRSTNGWKTPAEQEQEVTWQEVASRSCCNCPLSRSPPHLCSSQTQTLLPNHKHTDTKPV